MTDRGITYISFYLRSNTVRVYTNALREIGEPGFVRFLINAERMEMAMEPYHRKEFQSFRVPKGLYRPEGRNYKSMQVHSKAFCQLLGMRLGWDSRVSYRVPGRVKRKQGIVVYELKKAEIIGDA